MLLKWVADMTANHFSNIILKGMKTLRDKISGFIKYKILITLVFTALKYLARF